MFATLLIICIISVIAFILIGKEKVSLPTKTITDNSKSKQKGMIGEQLVQTQGDKFLDKNSYMPFHNITLYNGETTTQIDHMYLSIYGIFVLETKHYSGWIYGNQYDKTWTQTFKNKKFKFVNPMHQNYGHIKFLENFLTIEFEKFHSVIVFSGDSRFKTHLPNSVCMLDNFCDYILSFQTILFTPTEINALAHFLKNKILPTTDNASTFHIHHLNNKRV